MLANFERDECIECDVHIAVINALHSIAQNELEHRGTTGFLLTIAQAIEKESSDMISLLKSVVGKSE